MSTLDLSFAKRNGLKIIRHHFSQDNSAIAWEVATNAYSMRSATWNNPPNAVPSKLAAQAKSKARRMLNGL